METPTTTHARFSKPIAITLTGPDAVREYALANRDNKNWTAMYSDWLVALIHEIRETQYPYNSVVQREAEKRLGLPKFDDSGSALSGLVYSCQRFAHEETIIEKGFQLIDTPFLEKAFASGGNIIVRCEGMLGSSDNPFRVRKTKSGYAVCPPRSRTKQLALYGNVWAKIQENQ